MLHACLASATQRIGNTKPLFHASASHRSRPPRRRLRALRAQRCRPGKNLVVLYESCWLMRDFFVTRCIATNTSDFDALVSTVPRRLMKAVDEGVC
jgi:hypothetical protein